MSIQVQTFARFALSATLSLPLIAAAAGADDMATLATGGYAAGLRTPDMMHKIDANGDGMVSKEEWLAFQDKVFAMLHKNASGTVDAAAFVHSEKDVATIATGGYARGLLTKEMMAKIDADRDGTVSREEFIAYQTRVFDMMNTSTAHQGMLSPAEFFATGAR